VPCLINCGTKGRSVVLVVQTFVVSDKKNKALVSLLRGRVFGGASSTEGCFFVSCFGNFSTDFYEVGFFVGASFTGSGFSGVRVSRDRVFSVRVFLGRGAIRVSVWIRGVCTGRESGAIRVYEYGCTGGGVRVYEYGCSVRGVLYGCVVQVWYWYGCAIRVCGNTGCVVRGCDTGVDTGCVVRVYG